MAEDGDGLVLYRIFLLTATNDEFVREVRATIAEELQELELLKPMAGDGDPLQFQSGHARVWRVPGDRGIGKLWTDDPAICLYMSPEDEPDAALETVVDEALDHGHLVIPIARDREGWEASIPESLRDHNVAFWSEAEERRRVVRTVLDEIGFGERDRRVFISYRRKDGAAMAVQLYQELATLGFDVFLDQFDVRRGAIVQDEIEEAIDDTGFLLVLESPLAHESEWIEREIVTAMRYDDYPLLALTWPDTTEHIATLPQESGLRHHIEHSDLELTPKGAKLKDEVLPDVVDAIYLEHAVAVGRRRRSMINSVVEAGEAEGWQGTLVGSSSVLLRRNNPHGEDVSWLVGVSSRTPRPLTHFRLDTQVLPNGLIDPSQKFLLHTALAIDDEVRQLNAWAIEQRNMEELHVQTFLNGGYL